VLALVKVPEHGDAVLATGSSEGAIGRDGDGVDGTSVAVVVGLELELLELPDLDAMSASSKVGIDKARGGGDQRSW
jgi:hypothetical protein